MAHSNRLEQEIHGPSMFEVTLGAALSLLLGGVLAAGYLIAQPVETVRSMPREPDPEKVYYVTGSARSSLGKQWLRKKQMLAESGAITIAVTEDELNTWLASSKSSSSDDEEGGLLTAKRINFRIRDDALQVGIPCELNMVGMNRDIVIQARGGFVRSGDRFVYQPSEIMIGQLAAHKLPLVGSLVMNRIVAGQEIPADMMQAWDSLSDVRVQGNQLMLARR